jgi:UrcA family protein
MPKKSHPYKHLLLAAAGLAAMAAPLAAQPVAPRWKPGPEVIVVTANFDPNWRNVLTGTSISSAIAVSASLPVPYGDLDLTRPPDVDEFGRRINVAAGFICRQLDVKYPPQQYPILNGDDCFQSAVNNGMTSVSQIVAAVRQ